MKTERIKFTQKVIDALPVPESGQKIYYDTDSNDGLCILASYGGSKTYFMQMYFGGRGIKTKLGSAHRIKLAEAKILAHTAREKAEQGVDPIKERNVALRDMTLKRYFYEQYYPRHVQVYTKPKTQAKEDTMFRNNLAPFHNRKMMSITRAEVERLHVELKERISLYTANRAIGMLKHMYNKAIEWGYPAHNGNPAVGIKMFREKSRERFLMPDEVRRFFAALAEEPNEMFRNYVLLSLFIGQRRSNMLSMRWSNIDLNLGVVLFPDSKNGEPQRIPLITQAIEILSDMRRYAKDDWVFSSNAGSKSGHVEDFHRPWYALLKRAGIEDMRIHDLRRTFGSYQAITGASLHIIGKALGDKTSAATRVYSRLTMDPIRDSIQRAADKMLEFVE